ncbi:uncharacterized protein LOC134339576 [Mobula hypostoma]|uniref:uncharacterized protein LOC134339576 n=1 Tax=Mobula hypostoma TaxID=723540 RepID=UPI002FC2C7FE
MASQRKRWVSEDRSGSSISGSRSWGKNARSGSRADENAGAHVDTAAKKLQQPQSDQEIETSSMSLTYVHRRSVEGIVSRRIAAWLSVQVHFKINARLAFSDAVPFLFVIGGSHGEVDHRNRPFGPSKSTWAGYITWHLRSPSPIRGDTVLRKLPRLSLLLARGIVGTSSSVAQTLTGCWTNELGSTAYIKKDEDGTLRGFYISAVSSAETPVEGELIGFQVDIEQPTFGFVVKWTSEEVRGDVSVWTGQMFEDQTLKTMWLARSHSSVDSNWEATVTGMDVFTRYIEKCGSTDGDGSERKYDPSKEGS